MGRLFCLFTGWFVHLHNWSVRSQNAYLWIYESCITSILETPNFCLCAMTLKEDSFFFFLFLPFCPLSSFFYLLSPLPFYLPFYQFLHFCLFSQITKLKCKKVLSLSGWETSQEFNRKLSRG